MDVDELKQALGGIVLESAYLERVLRASLSALVGSKYTAAIDGRMAAHALIEDCRRLTRVHSGVPDTAKDALDGALNACDVVNKKRNRVIHDAWAYLPAEMMATLQGQRDSQNAAAAEGTVAGLTELAGQIGAAAGRLTAAVTSALGADSLRIEDELRLELGHDVNADIG